MARTLTINPQAPVQFGWIEIKKMIVNESTTAYEQLLQCAVRFKNEYADTTLSQVPGVQAGRQFFRNINIDPTKRRPSSESLLNRALKDKGFFAVNTLVDVGNWCSLDFLLPICVYDAEKISGAVQVRMGRQAEKYLALNNREMDFTNRLVIADENGAFGSPMTDSLRTAVSTSTTQTLLGIWAPQNFERSQLLHCIDAFAQRSIEICGGDLIDSGILG